MARKLNKQRRVVASKAVSAKAKAIPSAAVAAKKEVVFDPKKIKAVLFDADNTLFPIRDIAKECDYEALKLFEDEGADHKQVLLAFYDTIGKLRSLDDPEKRFRTYSYGLIAKKFGIRPQVAVAAERKFRELMLSKIAPYPAARRFIEKLQKGYSVKLAVVTCAEREWALEKLEAAGLMDFFDAIVTTTETKRMKPHSSYYTLACKHLKVRPQDCVMIGDSEAHDLEPARKLGMHAFLADYEKLAGIFP
ncbi:MAG: HAD family hydrolase [Candidatus Micrarchaeia archaeon]